MTRFTMFLASTVAAAALMPTGAEADATHRRPGHPSPPGTSCTLSRSCTPGASINVMPYVSMLRSAGRLRLDVVPAHAEVYVDGVYAGHAEQFDGVSPQAALAPGAHRIDLRAEGYDNVAVGARIDRSQVTVRRVMLSPTPRR
jgi:hypothetical protein